MLGEKYPNLYSGVLDVCGPKNTTMSYEYKMLIGSMSIEEIRSYLGWPPAVPDSAIQDFKNFCLMSAADIEIACGGTPQEKPKAYERRSPVYYPEVSVPVIIVHGENDFIVPISQSESYEQAVNDATEPDLCRLYPVAGVPPAGGHCTPDVRAQGIFRFYELVAWSNTLDP
jgi:pimeloyl-ACP methyl ester carboxylesterase